MDWLEHDEVSREALPEWAREPGDSLDGGPYRVRAHAAGLVIERHALFSVVPWSEVLVPVRLEEPRRLLLAAARRPPRPPWFELGGEAAQLEQVIRTRLDAMRAGSYRARRALGEAVPPDVILTRVLAREPLPGAVEIPAAGHSVGRSALAGAFLGGGFLGLYGLAFGAPGLVAGAALGMLGGAGVLGGIERVRNRSTGRVLVLAPDGFVGGLDGQSVQAVSWSRVGRFVDGMDDFGQSALEVYAPTGELLARVGARFFGQPLDVIVAVAEAYRRRAVESAG